MDKDELRELSNVLNSEFGLNTVFVLLKKFGAFERGLNRTSSTKEDYLTLGKREQGVWLLDCVFKANKDKYMQILEMNQKEKENL